jgi:hypothetical protein
MRAGTYEKNWASAVLYEVRAKADGTSENTAYHTTKQNHTVDGIAREYYDSLSHQGIWLVLCNTTECILGVMLDLSHSFHDYVTSLFSFPLFTFHRNYQTVEYRYNDKLLVNSGQTRLEWSNMISMQYCWYSCVGNCLSTHKQCVKISKLTNAN